MLLLIAFKVTVLLGHNGAGKSTTYSMICGTTNMTTGKYFTMVRVIDLGSITIFGQNLQTNLSSCRSSMGFCPQFNCIFEHLTVNDHFWFFSKLKGGGGWKVDADELCSSVGMQSLRKKATVFETLWRRKKETVPSTGICRRIQILGARRANSWNGSAIQENCSRFHHKTKAREVSAISRIYSVIIIPR
ncbi:hypothetical protein COOONC_00847 [Cooperia oncophora]